MEQGAAFGSERSSRRTWMLPLNELCRKHLVLTNASCDDDVITVLDLIIKLLNNYPQATLYSVGDFPKCNKRVAQFAG